MNNITDINYISTVREINANQMNISPETGVKYTDTVRENEMHPSQEYTNNSTTIHSYNLKPLQLNARQQFNLTHTRATNNIYGTYKATCLSNANSNEC